MSCVFGNKVIVNIWSLQSSAFSWAVFCHKERAVEGCCEDVVCVVDFCIFFFYGGDYVI